MKLTELRPSWLDAPGRWSVGLQFDCPIPQSCGCLGRHSVLFHNPLDSGPRLTEAEMMALPPEIWAQHPGSPVRCWHRAGGTFEDLSLAPRLDFASGWWLWLTQGEVLVNGPYPRPRKYETWEPGRTYPLGTVVAPTLPSIPAER